MGFWHRSRASRRRRWRRGALALLLIANQVVICAGLPLPAVAAAPQKDRGQPFPCMDRPCGCMNAQQCWRSCCCFSMQEKLAWAEAHHIEPPAYVREEAEREARESKRTRETCPACGHCSQRSGPTSQTGSVCAAGSAERASCPNCAKQASPRAELRQTPQQGKVPEPQPLSTRWVVWIMALGCQGHDALGLLAHSPALPAFHFAFPLDEPRFVEPVSIATFPVRFFSVSPPDPPPRGEV